MWGVVFTACIVFYFLHYSFLVRYARVWPWAPIVQLVSCHNQFVSSILWPNATALLPNKFYMLTCDWAPDLMTGLPILFQPWLFWYKSTCSKISCGTVNSLTSIVLMWTSERDTWSFEHSTLMAAQEGTTANFSLITESAHYPRKKPWQLVLLTAFPSTCS